MFLLRAAALNSSGSAYEDGLSKLPMAFDELLESSFVFVSNSRGEFRVTPSPTREPRWP